MSSIELSPQMAEICQKNSLVRAVVKNGGSFEDCIAALAKHLDVLADRMMVLESIAPRSIRLSNGTKMIYRCPDHLVPEVEA